MNDVSEQRKRELEGEILKIAERLNKVADELKISINIDSGVSFVGNSEIKTTCFHFHDHSNNEYKYRVCVPASKVMGILSSEFDKKEDKEEQDEV